MRHGLFLFLARRTAAGALTLVAASVVVFIGTNVLPGSPGEAALGRLAAPQEVAQIDHRLGWDKPVIQRYETWAWKSLHGDLGNSSIAVAQGATSAPIWPLIRGPLSNTTILALLALAALVPISLVFGTLAGIYNGRWPDHAISTTALIFVAMPEFVTGSLLVVIFFVVLKALPPVSLVSPGASPLTHPTILVLPVLTLLAASVAWTVRLIRAGTVEIARSDFVELPRIHGVPKLRIVRRYILRNSLVPSIQIFALTIQYLFGGVIVTETVFDYPGIGKQLVDAVVSHDNTEVQAIALILAAIYIAINILADLAVILLVPKLRTQA